jgi:hypothetical protein
VEVKRAMEIRPAIANDRERLVEMLGVRLRDHAVALAGPGLEPACPDWLDVTVGSFDRPQAIEPDSHIHVSSQLPWVHLDDSLPRYPEAGPVGCAAGAGSRRTSAICDTSA